MLRTYIGIDPGVGGGMARVWDDGTLARAVPMPATEKDVLELLASWSASIDVRGNRLLNVRAVLEFVRSSPQMGVASAFKFGCGYGALKMALVATEIPYDEVTPQKWQAVMGCRSGGDKNVTKRRAQELFPSVKVTHALADALLIAEYARRKGNALLHPAAPANLMSRPELF